MKQSYQTPNVDVLECTASASILTGSTENSVNGFYNPSAGLVDFEWGA